MFDSHISGELLVEEVGQVVLPEGVAGTPTALTSQGSLLCLLQGGTTKHLFTFFKTLIRGAACVGVRNTDPSRHRGFEN